MSTKDETKAAAFLNTYGEWFYRALVICGFVAVLYLNQHYVTKTDFTVAVKAIGEGQQVTQQQISGDIRTVSLRVDTLATAMNTLNTTVALAQQKQLEIDDLKNRVRDLERTSRRTIP